MKVSLNICVFAWTLQKVLFPPGTFFTTATWRRQHHAVSMERGIWAMADEELTKHMCYSATLDANVWLTKLQETLKRYDFVKVLVILWVIWTARRKVIHGAIFQSLGTLMGFVESLLQELSSLPKKLQLGSVTRNVQEHPY